MKGSPMKRNFNIGSPLKQDDTKSKGSTNPHGTFSSGGWSEEYQDAYQQAYKRNMQKKVNTLVDKRKGLEKGSDEYNKVQNKINSLLDDPTRHGKSNN